MRTRALVELNQDEILARLDVDPKSDEADLWDYQSDFLRNDEDKVLYIITKVCMIPDKVFRQKKVGKWDAIRLYIELDFKNGTSKIINEVRERHDKGQTYFSENLGSNNLIFSDLSDYLLEHHENLRLDRAKPTSIKRGLELAKSSLEKGKLAKCFNDLFDLYFLERYAGTQLHSAF